jgi:hypothetical protein
MLKEFMLEEEGGDCFLDEKVTMQHWARTRR